MNHCSKLITLALLAAPLMGRSQQTPAQRPTAHLAAQFASLVAAAQQAQAAGDYQAAANDYQQAVKVHADMPELWANLGLMQHQAGKYPDAILSFQHANRLNPSLYVPNLFLGIDTLRAGKAKEAIPFLEKAAKLNKTDPQPALSLGRAYLSVGKYSPAIEELDRAAELNPKLSSAWFDLGIAHLHLVEESGRRMSDEDQNSPYAKALYAESLVKQARYHEAADQYQGVIAATAQPPCMHAELGFALLKQHDSSGATVEFSAEQKQHPECGMAILGQARVALDADDHAESLRLMEELWSRDHGFFAANAPSLAEGVAADRASAFLDYVEQNRSASQADLSKTLRSAFAGTLSAPDAGEVDKQPSHLAHSTAEEYYLAGNFSQCAAQLPPGITRGHADKLLLLATCTYFAGQYQRSTHAAAELTALQPRSMSALYWSIKAEEHLAFESLARFQQLEPDSARTHVLMGDMYRQRERYTEAQSEYSKALDLAPGDPAAMLGLATAYLEDGKIDKALETTRTALVRSPDDPELDLVTAEAMLEQNDFSHAEPFLAKSMAHAKPQVIPHIHALLGKVYAETGRTQDAIRELTLGASSDVDGTIQYQLARLYRKTGDTKAASDALERMKLIKQQRHDRGVKAVEDSDLPALEPTPTEPPKP